MPRGKFDKRKIKVIGDMDLDPETDALVTKKIAEADAELAQQEVRVNFRWRKQQLWLVQQAAEKIGIPYQTYVKHVLFKQASADLKDLKL